MARLSDRLVCALACQVLLLCWHTPSEGSDAAMTYGTFANFLEFLSPAAIPQPKSWVTRQASGYDREGGFYDSGSFIRSEHGRRHVLMEERGPGCIDRMWFTYKKALGEEPYDLLFYLDDDETPALQVNLDELFSGKFAPFVEPLAGRCADALRPGRYSYVPIGFQRSCKVVLVPTAPEDAYNYRTTETGRTIPHIYYQITYRVFPEGTPVHRYDWPRDAAEEQALVKVSAFLNGEGSHATVNEFTARVDVTPEGSTTLGELPGSGLIEEWTLETIHAENLHLSVFWDNNETPAIDAPLDVFFASTVAPEPGTDHALWLSRSENTFRCRLPMPFEKGARFVLKSNSTEVISVTANFRISVFDKNARLTRLHASRYDHQVEADGDYYDVLDVTGAGHFVGLVMDRPGHMEGDDRFFVDGEEAPSIHGTGTEDFFSFAWGLSHVARLPLHGISRGPAGPLCYRFHLPAGVPFTKSLHIEWEHGHDPDKGPNLHAGRYSGLVYYYLQPTR